jgi:hypothetical protein
MKQFEIVTEPIQTEQYREFTINEYQGGIYASYSKYSVLTPLVHSRT